MRSTKQRSRSFGCQVCGLGSFHTRAHCFPACVRFLQACSQVKVLHNLLRSHDVLERMTTILFIEDRNSSNVVLRPRGASEIAREDYRPSLVEHTLGGRQVEYLLRALVGYRSVAPHRVVAPRILRRIADVLMGLPDPPLEMLRETWGIAADSGAADENDNGEDHHSDGTREVGTINRTGSGGNLAPWAMSHSSWAKGDGLYPVSYRSWAIASRLW